MIRAELFLREKDQWHDLATHMECIFKEILRSAEHVGVRERDHKPRCWGKKDHSPPRAPTTSHATAFEQICSSNNHQLIRSLVVEVYQGHLEIGQYWLMADNLRSLSDKIKDKLRAHIWGCRSACASSSSLEAVGPSVRYSARSPLRIESAAACSTSQGCSTKRGCGTKEDTVPVEGINHPSRGGLPAGPGTDVRVGVTALRVGGTTLQIEEVP